MGQFVVPLGQLPAGCIHQFGGKASNLGDLIKEGFNIPPGFCISAEALDYLIEKDGLANEIINVVKKINYDNLSDIKEKTKTIKDLITGADIPVELYREIVESYRSLSGPSGQEPYVAVRSSVAVRGTSISSFPGMMDTYHYILGEEQVVEYVKCCWASLWSARAVSSRHQQNVDQNMGIIAPIVQKMVNSDVAGVLFTAHPISKKIDQMVIESNWGLGESVVSGRGMTDFYVVDKNSLKVIDKVIQKKTIMVVLDKEKGSGRKECQVYPEKATLPTLSDAQIKNIGITARNVEEYFGGVPQDIEWAYEGDTLYILQARKIKNLN